MTYGKRMCTEDYSFPRDDSKMAVPSTRMFILHSWITIYFLWTNLTFLST